MNKEVMYIFAIYMLLSGILGFVLGVLFMWVKQRYYDAVGKRLAGKDGVPSGWFSSMKEETKQTLVIASAIAVVIVSIAVCTCYYYIRLLIKEENLAKTMSESGYVYKPARSAGWVEEGEEE